MLPAAFLLPSRDALFLGDRVIVYLPRCADTNAEVRKLSAQVSFLLIVICGLVKVTLDEIFSSSSHGLTAWFNCSFFCPLLQILDVFFSISLSLPRPIASSSGVDIELSYSALSSLEDVIAILRRVSAFAPFTIQLFVVISIGKLNLGYHSSSSEFLFVSSGCFYRSTRGL